MLVALGLVVAMLAARPLQGWVFSRDLALIVSTRQPPAPFKIEWAAADPAIPPSGCWQGLPADPLAVSADAVPSATRDKIAWSLPWYELASLRLTWEQGAPQGLSVTEVAVRTRFLGKVVWRQSLPDAIPDASGAVLVPPALPRWAAGPAFLVALGLEVAALTLWTLLSAIDGLWTRAQQARSASRARAASRQAGPTRVEPSPLVRAGCFALVLLFPLWMLAWAPLKVTTDGTEYLKFAQSLLEHPSFRVYEGWRQPGYSGVLALLLRFNDLVVAIGVMHLAMGVATSLLAFVLVRRFSRGWAPYLAMVGVAACPMVLAWQRTVMSETISGLLIMVSACLLLHVCLLVERSSKFGAFWCVLGGALLGALFGFGALVRSNLLILPVLSPLAVLVVGLRARHAWRAVATVAAMTLVAISLVAPLVLEVHRRYDRWGVSLQANASRQLQSWQNGTTDWNQSAFFPLERFQALRRRVASEPMNEYDFMYELLKNPVPDFSLPKLVRYDVVCQRASRESFARLGPAHAKVALKAVASQLGFRVRRPWAFQGSVESWLSDILRRPSGERTTLAFRPVEEFTRLQRVTQQRAVRPLNNEFDTLNGHAFAAWWSLWRFCRPVGSVLFLVAMTRLVRRREWPLACVGMWFLANGVALGVLLYAGEDRYAMPFYPAAMALTLAALSVQTERNPKKPSAVSDQNPDKMRT